MKVDIDSGKIVAKLVTAAYEATQADPIIAEVLKHDGMTAEYYRLVAEYLFRAACRAEWAAEQLTKGAEAP